MAFSDITVVNVDGGGSGEYAVYAIEESMRQLPGSKGLLISTKRPDNLSNNIQWRYIESFGYYEYSIFMMFCLHTFIDTEFALVVQDDGWVLNGENWKDIWRYYDYVGSPCHAAIKGDEIALKYEWVGKDGYLMLQNGGFSLRSKRFMETPSTHGIPFRDMKHPMLKNEDIQLNFILRNAMERTGIVYAPTEAALSFGVEFIGPKVHDNLDLNTVLGHHSQIRRLRGYKKIQYQCTKDQIKDIFGEEKVISLLESLGYEISYKE